MKNISLQSKAKFAFLAKFSPQIFLFCAVLLMSSCEDVIQIDVPTGPVQIAVDGWINNLPSEQKIVLTKTSPYFENTASPVVIGAEVFVEDLTSKTIFEFKDPDNNGEYTFTPSADKKLGELGHNFKLTIRADGEEYNSFSKTYNTTKVDSITYKEEKAAIGREEGFFAEMFGRDLKGQRDFYWIKTFRNGEFLGRPADMNYAVNAVPAGSSNGTDGLVFIPPIRQRITQRDFPYKLGDVVRVEIHSITAESHEFLSQVQSEILNGGLFATQPNNVSTNIVNAKKDGKKAVGWFCVSQTQFLEVTIKK